MAEDNKKEVKEEKKQEQKPDTVAVEKTEKAKEEKPASVQKKKKIRHQIQRGQAHIQCSYNNTMISITDLNGQLLAWSSSGLLGFKGAKKSTPYASTQVAGDVVEKVRKFGVSELEVYVKGVGSGREAAIRALVNKGFNLALIKDMTPIPHNGCRPRKPRRV